MGIKHSHLYTGREFLTILHIAPSLAVPDTETEFRFVEKVHVGTLAPKITVYTPLIWVLTARDGDRIQIAFEYIMIHKGESLQVSTPQCAF